MHPVIFKIGWFELRSYGLLLATAFVVGIIIAFYRAKKQGMDPGVILDLSFLIVLSSIIGARFLYVIFHLDEFQGHWLDVVNPFQSSGQVGIAGLTMLGGLLLAIIVTLVFLTVKRLPILKVTDIMAPSVALGIFITRIGCFLNGCCFGKPSALPWALVFPSDSPAGFTFPNVTIHPSQLYSSLYGLVIFTILVATEKYKRFDGFTFFSLLLLYSIARFLVDFTRYYENSMVLLRIGTTTISVNQGISVALFGVGLFLMLWFNRRGSEKITKTS